MCYLSKRDSKGGENQKPADYRMKPSSIRRTRRKKGCADIFKTIALLGKQNKTFSSD